MNLFIFINKMFSCAYVLVFFICLANLKSQYTYHSGVLLQAPNKKKLIILFWELRNLGFDNQVMEH